jgi:autotransporter family porin
VSRRPSAIAPTEPPVRKSARSWRTHRATYLLVVLVVAACVAPSVRPPGGGSSGSKRFLTLPPGSALPSDATCAARVRPASEVRASNAVFNRTRGHRTSANADPNYPRYGRVTGNYAGTTDEIIQWVACKWGIDEDVVRAQAAKETYWFQKNLGDFGTDPTRCVPGHPIGKDGVAGRCPESIGIMQIRYPYFRTTITDAITSTAYNLDLAYAVWRTCYEGEERWLNDVERGRQYAKGDLWGCVGRWFSGRWYTPPALDYIAAVKGYVNQRIWTTSGFIHFRG